MSARPRLIAGAGGAWPADSSPAPPASSIPPPTGVSSRLRDARQFFRRLGQHAAAQQRQADLGAVALPIDVRVQRRLAGLRQR